MKLLENTPLVVFLIVATTLEVTGDAMIRKGLYDHAGAWRIALATLPNLPVLAAGALIVIGGLIVSFWKPA
jgi:hypothetical protein